MIHIVCGLIGAGKSTFVKSKLAKYTDQDDIGDKQKQIQETINIASRNFDVYHITLFPTEEEIRLLGIYEHEFIWINTTFDMCRKNIIKRNRDRDVNNFPKTLIKNREILSKYLKLNIMFKIIDIFQTNERW